MANTAEDFDLTPEQEDGKPNYHAIKQSLGELETLYERKKAASEMYSAGIEAVAEKANVNKSNLNAFVKAHCEDKERTGKQAADELYTLFEECGAQMEIVEGD